MGTELLIQGVYGGRVERTGPRRLRARYPHLFITVLLMFPAVVFVLGGLGMLLGALLRGPLLLLPGALLGGVFGAVLALVARHRARTMGEFELDVDAGILRRVRRGRELEAWPLARITRVAQRWDPFHRGFQRVYWLTVTVDDGRELRLGKGVAAELSRTLGLLSEWGLPVSRPA